MKRDVIIAAILAMVVIGAWMIDNASAEVLKGMFGDVCVENWENRIMNES